MAEMNSEITELLAQAMRAIQYGHKPAAAAYLNRILELDPENMDAWRWLAECMPNQAKRNYCLERAGLSASNVQPLIPSSSRISSTIGPGSFLDGDSDPDETTLAEKHVRKAAIRGQKKAELPPHYNTTPTINFEIPKSNTPIRRPATRPDKPRNNLPPVQVRVPRKKRRGLSLRALGYSALAVAVCTIAGYVLFSTGLTTGERVWNWIILQVKNNTSDISLFSTDEKPQSTYNLPAEEPVLATYFPTPAGTPEPIIIQDEDARVSAELPADEPVIIETETAIVEEPQETAEQEQVDATATVEDAEPVEVAPVPTQAPTDFIDGPIIIGHSIKGNNIEVMQFGNGPVERMIVAGIHGGNEWNTTLLADELIEYLKQNPRVVPADRTLYILRLLNPDGEARGHNLDGRVNERGVDLNRNWDNKWVIDWPRDGCWNYRPVSAGSEPFSEPEVVALRDFLLERKVSALINYHSAALGIFPGGQPPEAESVRLAEAIAAVTNYSYPPMDTGCAYTGQFADWLAARGTAAIDLELTNHTDSDFDQNLRVLNVLLKWEPSTGPKSLTELINIAETTPPEPNVFAKVEKFCVQTMQKINIMVFGVQEEK